MNSMIYTNNNPPQTISQTDTSDGPNVLEKTVDFDIEGMSCASCVRRIETSIKKNPDVHQASVNLALEKAHVVLGPKGSAEAVRQAIEEAGYKAKLIVDTTLENQTVQQTPSPNIGNSTETDLNLKMDAKDQAKLNQLEIQKFQVYLAALLSTPLVIPMLVQPFGIHLMIPAWIQFLLALPVQFWLGAKFYSAAWKALKNFSGNMDLLVALGTTAAFGLSLYLWLGSPHAGHGNATDNGGHLYFEGAAVIITLVLFGKYLEAKAKFKTTAAIKALQSLKPEKAWLRQGQTIQEIPTSLVKNNDELLIKPGEKIPVDGLIIEGSSQVDESLITGESLPVEKHLQDKVIGGSINLNGTLVIKATAVGSETTLSRIVRLVESAQSAKAPVERLVDRVSQIFVPIVILIALMTLLFWGFYSCDWEKAIINGVAVLVIACPCALGLATPASIIVGTGAAAKAGILIKDAEALETAHSVTVVAFDKTGTLTEGQPEVSKIMTANNNSNEFLHLLSSLQARSEHPLAKAVLKKAQAENIQPASADNVKAIPGKGLSGQIHSKTFYVGSEKLMKDLGLSIEVYEKTALKHEQSGETISYLADGSESKVLGFISFGDKAKKEAKETIDQLHKLNVKTVMLTGDNEGSAKKIASELGITNYKARVLPEDKSNYIQQLKSQNEIVAMVGDGINDAPALALADVGIAMSTGTDVAMHTAGLTLMRGNPLLIPDAISISRQTYNKIKQNLFWAFIYNIVGIPLAAAGLLSPVIAGAAMAFSSFSVVSNALLLNRWKAVSQTTKGNSK